MQYLLVFIGLIVVLQLFEITKRLKHMSQATQNAILAIGAMSGVSQSAVAALDHIQGQLQELIDNGNDDPGLQTAVDDLNANKDALAQAIARDPGAPSSSPAPTGGSSTPPAGSTDTGSSTPPSGDGSDVPTI